MESMGHFAFSSANSRAGTSASGSQMCFMHGWTPARTGRLQEGEREAASGEREGGRGLGYRVSGVGCRVSGVGYRVSGIGYRVSGVGYRGPDADNLVSGMGRREE